MSLHRFQGQDFQRKALLRLCCGVHQQFYLLPRHSGGALPAAWHLTGISVSGIQKSCRLFSKAVYPAGQAAAGAAAAQRKQSFHFRGWICCWLYRRPCLFQILFRPGRMLTVRIPQEELRLPYSAGKESKSIYTYPLQSGQKSSIVRMLYYGAKTLMNFRRSYYDQLEQYGHPGSLR